MTTAVNVFLRTAIREHGIPFELKLEVPNDTTAAAIEEGRKRANQRIITCINSLKIILIRMCFSHFPHSKEALLYGVSPHKFHNKKEQKFISLLTSTTSYCIIGTGVHELLSLVYRNSCSLSSRLYKKIAASHRQLSLPAKNSKISHMEA